MHLYCQACDEMLPLGDVKICDKCGHKAGDPAPEKYRFGPPGEAFGGWMRVPFGLGIITVFVGLFVFFSSFGRFGFELFSNTTALVLVLHLVALVSVSMVFIILLHNGKREAYTAFIVLSLLVAVWLVWSFFTDSPRITTIFTNVTWIIVWLVYFYRSERVLEHFGTNFPIKWQQMSTAKDKRAIGEPSREIGETLKEQEKHIEEKQEESARRQKVKQISIILASILIVIAVVFATIEIAQNAERAQRQVDAGSQSFYAYILDFNFRLMRDGEQFEFESWPSPSVVIRNLMSPNSSYFDPFYTEFILAYTEKEAFAHPDNVITAWPSTQTLKNINALNWAMRESTDLAEISLEFPITLIDVVENWEKISGSDAMEIFWLVRDDDNRRYGNSPEFIAEMEQLLWEALSKDVQETKVSVDDVRFAENFNFDFRMVADGRVITDAAEILLRTQALYPKFFDPTYTDFVFVETKEEALTFPDNVITTWPSQETQEMINTLNWIIQYEGRSDGEGIGLYQNVDVSNFQFCFPITTTDMFEDRDEFNKLWRSLGRFVHESIRDSSSLVRRVGNYPEFIAELERLRAERDAEASE